MHQQHSTFWTHLVPALLLPYAVLIHIHNTFACVECRCAMRLKWVPHNFKWEEGKKEKKKPGTKKVGLLSFFFPLLSSFCPPRIRSRVQGADSWSQCCCEPPHFQDRLKDAVRGGECQNGRVKYAVRWAGGSHWWGESQWQWNTTSVHPSTIDVCCTEQTHNQIETHGHTLRLTLSGLQWYPFIICTRGLLRTLACLTVLSTAPPWR